MTTKIESGDELSNSEVSNELFKKAAELKERTALLKEEMELTQSEVKKILHPEVGDDSTKN